VEEMSAELMDRGREGTRLEVLGGASFEGDRLAKLVKVLSELEESLQILERRGLNLSGFLAKAGPAGLPPFRVLLAGQEHGVATTGEVDAFRQAEQARLGKELVLADDSPERSGGNGHGNGNGHTATFFVQEFHEVRGINRGLDRLREVGLDASCLVE